ncbi:hypothetical protein L7F22_063474 [Adiantum nelumboides]|nr:hypothetical protein [Adiantum nelumboides]
MDLNGLEGGTAVTSRFPGLLPEFAPHVNEIGRCMGFVVGDAVIPEDEDRTISIRMVQFISLPTIHGGEILQRVFFIGLPGHCFVCGRKGHVAAACTRHRISPDQRQQASKQEALHANGGLDDRLMLFNASLENACSEQGARMSAMDSSTRNATEMLDKLTLKYNRSRQASITTELIEIISGAAALEASS